MRGLWSTGALVLILAGLGAYIYFVDSERPAAGSTANEKVFEVEADAIQEMRITSGDATSVLVRKESGWQLTEPVQADADPTESASLVSNLTSMESSRVVQENAEDLAPFGLAEPRIRIAWKGEGASGELHFGDKTPLQGDIYALKPGERKVFLVSSYLETTFDKKPFDLRDKRVVKFERDKVDSVELTRGKDAIRMSRSGSDWTIQAPMAGRADYAAVEGLLTRLSTAGMASIVESQGGDLGQYGLEAPAMQITLGAGSSQTILEISGPDNDRRFARDRARPMVFTLDSTLADDLTKAFDDYYKKDLFEARPFSTDRVRLTRATGGAARTWEFVKSTGDGGETWQATPEGGQAIDVDRAKMDELLNRLTALRVGTLVTRGSTGLDRPVLTVAMSYDGGKFERVRIGQAGKAYYGNRQGEAVTGEVDEAAVTGALEALDTALAPPAPPAEAPAKP